MVGCRRYEKVGKGGKGRDYLQSREGTVVLTGGTGTTNFLKSSDNFVLFFLVNA